MRPFADIALMAPVPGRGLGTPMVVSGPAAETVARLEQGSHQHARRREHEMAAASDLLDELSVPPRVTRASQLWLNELATED